MTADVVVIGAGLTGLATACMVARAGRKVIVLERSAEVGGRARTSVIKDFSFNLGPHALYKESERILRDLGVAVEGSEPSASGAFALHSGKLHTFPAGLVSLCVTGLLRSSEKLEAAKLLARIAKSDAANTDPLNLSEWLQLNVRSQRVRSLLRALVRVGTFSDDQDRLSASASFQQLREGLRGVKYVDGGWSSIVEGLRRSLHRFGGEVLSSTGARSIVRDRGVRGVVLDDGSEITVPAVVVAGSPSMAVDLLRDQPSAIVHEWARNSIPVRVACLEVALSRLPDPRRLIVIGIDEPLYVSVHSAAAKLAPHGGALIQTAWYGTGLSIERRLGEVLDLLQPGWSNHVVHRRFLPNLIASTTLVTASAGGLSGRPGPAVPDVPGMYVAGDWVGSEGMLTDACLASARRVASLVTTDVGPRAAAAMCMPD